MDKNSLCLKKEKENEGEFESPEEEIEIEEAVKSMEKVNKELKFNKFLAETSHKICCTRVILIDDFGRKKKNGKN